MHNATSLPAFESSLRCYCRGLLLCAVVLIAGTPGIAQFNVYHPFPDSNAVWGLLSGGTFCADISVQDYSAGDTIIGQYLYKVIDEYVTDPGSCSPQGLGAGFLRDDTISHKVYWRFPGVTSDSLLYDFTLDVGDTLRGLYGNTGLCADGVVTVTSIDSVEVGNSFRRRINLLNDPCFGPSIIEGIGSTTGLTSCYFMNKSFGIILTCFTVNGELLYEKPCGAPELAPCGALPLGLHHGQQPAINVVTPNPSTGQFTLGHAPPANTIAVYTSTGQQVWQGSGNMIDLTAQPPGVYTAVVAMEQGRQVVRMVVVR